MFVLQCLISSLQKHASGNANHLDQNSHTPPRKDTNTTRKTFSQNTGLLLNPVAANEHLVNGQPPQMIGIVEGFLDAPSDEVYAKLDSMPDSDAVVMLISSLTYHYDDIVAGCVNTDAKDRAIRGLFKDRRWYDGSRSNGGDSEDEDAEGEDDPVYTNGGGPPAGSLPYSVRIRSSDFDPNTYDPLGTSKGRAALSSAKI